MEFLNPPSWDEIYMSMAYLIAMKSKDTSTHVGTIIVGPDNEPRTLGYNNFPRGLHDEVESRFERPEKYLFFEHAERNALQNANRVGTPLLGCRAYVNFMICAPCARALTNAGIKEVIIHGCHPINRQDLYPEFDNKQLSARWAESSKAATEIFKECGVKLRFYNGSIITEITGRFNETVFKPRF